MSQQFSPQPAHGYTGAPPAPRKKSKAPKILMILGGAILALSVILGVVLAVAGFGNVASGAGKLQVLESGSGTYSAEADESLQLYVDEGTPAPSCTVTAPSGEAAAPGTAQSSELGTGERTWVSFDSFTATEAGDYTIDCGGTPVAVGPPVSIGGIFAGIGGVLMGVFGGMLGFLLLIVGVILHFVSKKKT